MKVISNIYSFPGCSNVLETAVTGTYVTFLEMEETFKPNLCALSFSLSRLTYKNRDTLKKKKKGRNYGPRLSSNRATDIKHTLYAKLRNHVTSTHPSDN